jgi:predicted deacetylase
MISKLKADISFLKNSIRDWSTKRKIIVIESDDWGSIRVPSSLAQENLTREGIQISQCPFLSFDNLEGAEDFMAIEKTIDSVFELTGKKAVITVNYILANPDYEKIKISGYKTYRRKYLWDYLLERNNLASYREHLNRLIEKGYFRPQLHGMEHLQVPYWMSQLQNGSEETILAFENSIYGISTNITSENHETYLAAFNYSTESEFDNHIRPALKVAANEFLNFFGYRSESFIAPNYVWSRGVEEVLAEEGVKIIQSSRFQILPKKYLSKGVRHFTGEKNRFGQIYLVRNCTFEPSTVKDKNISLKDCLNQVENAFRYRKPAIISIHRLNFMGGMDKVNQTQNLELLNEMLLTLCRKYPDIEFMSSDDLGKVIMHSKSYA